MKWLKYVLSFIIPVFFLLVMLAICGYFPFGSASLIIFDSHYEYIPFLMNLSNALHNNAHLFYTLNGALGTNFFGILCVYLGNPINLLVYFFNNESIYLFYTILIYVKIGISGLTMYIYLNSLRKDYQQSFWNLAFSSIYALSGYAVAFCMHIMWMDAYILLPIIIKYLDKLIMEDKGTLYSIFLGISIMINYYMGFMLALFTAIYFVYKSLIEKKFSIKSIIYYSIYTLLAAGLAAIIIVPNFKMLLTGRLSHLEFKKLLEIDNYTLFSMVYNLTPGSFVIQDNYNYGSATIYCTIFCFTLLTYYFFNKKILKRKRIITLILLLFFAVSFSFHLIDYAWTLFQQPVWWFHRYQFVYIFLLITISYDSFINMNDNISNKTKLFLIIMFAVINILSFSYKQRGLNRADYYILWLFLSVLLYYFYMMFFRNKKLISCLLLLELGINSFTILDQHGPYNNNNHYDYYDTLIQYQEKKDIIESVPRDGYKVVGFNDEEDAGFLYNYSSLSMFSSIYNYRTAVFYNQVGVANLSLNHQFVKNYNPAILSLLGVKYYIGENQYYSCENKICINSHAMPNMYQVNNSILDFKLKDKDVSYNVNGIYSSLLNDDITLMEPMDIKYTKFENIEFDDDDIISTDEDSKVVVEYKATEDEMLFFDDYRVLKHANIVINSKEINLNMNPNLYLQKNDYIIITIGEDIDLEEYKKHDFLINILKINSYEKAIQKLNSKVNSTTIEDRTNILHNRVITSDGILLINLPYDEGIRILVDGQETTYFPILDTFIGINISEGEHDVVVDYHIIGIKEGLILSILSVLLIIVIIFIKI